MKMRRYFLPVLVVLIFGFLYLPIVSMIAYSFNESRLVTVWSGFSFKWYAELLNNPQIFSAAWVSIRIAAASATAALVLGVLAAFALVRYCRKLSGGILSVMLATPLVMPDVMTGLSLLLLFVSLESIFGWPAGRGMLTVFIAHATFCTAFVAVIVRSRLITVDRALEEAAMDLGAKPWQVLRDVTLPAIAPALIAGWLLAFTLSLDDLVIASFVTGPQASTLPILVFSKVRLGLSPDINALAAIMITVIGCGIAFAAWMQARRD